MSDESDLRLGLTMRVVKASGYNESRDALAHDWAFFMNKVLPGARWISIPNIGNKIVDYAKYWRLNGFILTGGDDPGDVPIRDETEYALIKYAIENNLPVLGVCRGMQIICDYYNQKIIPCPNVDNHIATQHRVRLINNFMDWDEDDISLNSYHKYCLGSKELFKGPLIPFAISDDGLVEGVYCNTKPIIGIMWHPERNNTATEFNFKLIRMLFFG